MAQITPQQHLDGMIVQHRVLQNTISFCLKVVTALLGGSYGFGFIGDFWFKLTLVIPALMVAGWLILSGAVTDLLNRKKLFQETAKKAAATRYGAIANKKSKQLAPLLQPFPVPQLPASVFELMGAILTRDRFGEDVIGIAPVYYVDLDVTLVVSLLQQLPVKRNQHMENLIKRFSVFSDTEVRLLQKCHVAQTLEKIKELLEEIHKRYPRSEDQVGFVDLVNGLLNEISQRPVGAVFQDYERTFGPVTIPCLPKAPSALSINPQLRSYLQNLLKQNLVVNALNILLPNLGVVFFSGVVDSAPEFLTGTWGRLVTVVVPAALSLFASRVCWKDILIIKKFTQLTRQVYIGTLTGAVNNLLDELIALGGDNFKKKINQASLARINYLPEFAANGSRQRLIIALESFQSGYWFQLPFKRWLKPAPEILPQTIMVDLSLELLNSLLSQAFYCRLLLQRHLIRKKAIELPKLAEDRLEPIIDQLITELDGLYKKRFTKVFVRINQVREQSKQERDRLEKQARTPKPRVLTADERAAREAEAEAELKRRQQELQAEKERQRKLRERKAAQKAKRKAARQAKRVEKAEQAQRAAQAKKKSVGLQQQAVATRDTDDNQMGTGAGAGIGVGVGVGVLESGEQSRDGLVTTAGVVNELATTSVVDSLSAGSGDSEEARLAEMEKQVQEAEARVKSLQEAHARELQAASAYARKQGFHQGLHAGRAEAAQYFNQAAQQAHQQGVMTGVKNRAVFFWEVGVRMAAGGQPLLGFGSLPAPHDANDYWNYSKGFEEQVKRMQNQSGAAMRVR
jgi:hypothetical protein